MRLEENLWTTFKKTFADDPPAQRDTKAWLAATIARLVPASRSGDSFLFGADLPPAARAGWDSLPHQSGLDLVFATRAAITAPCVTVATAESEAYPQHVPALRDGDDTHDAGYFWDLYKLMQVASPLRFLLAPHSRHRWGQDVAVDVLRRELSAYVDRYGAALRKDDRLFLMVPYVGARPHTRVWMTEWRGSGRSARLVRTWQAPAPADGA